MNPTTDDSVHAGRRSGPVRRIRDVLRTRILEGVYAREPLPPEAHLALEFGASRNIIREVLSLLRDEGLVTRIQGSGTFVVAGKLVHGLDRLRGLAETFEARQPRVTNHVVLAEMVPAVPLVAERQVGLPPGALRRQQAAGALPHRASWRDAGNLLRPLSKHGGREDLRHQCRDDLRPIRRRLLDLDVLLAAGLLRRRRRNADHRSDGVHHILADRAPRSPSQPLAAGEAR